MSGLIDEDARVLKNEQVGPKLHLMVLESPEISRAVKPGQFVHMKLPGADSHVLRRPFSVYAADADTKSIDILYQEVGSVTSLMPGIAQGTEISTIGPIGNCWSGAAASSEFNCERALLVGGGVGAAPLFMLAETLVGQGCKLDVVLGAQTKDALVTRARYTELLGHEPECSTDDGSYAFAGFCTPLVQNRLAQGSSADGKPYDYLAVCGPEPLMRIVANLGLEVGVPTEVSMEKRMACGVGACLSCVVETKDGKRRSCVDGPIFDAREVVW